MHHANIPHCVTWLLRVLSGAPILCQETELLHSHTQAHCHTESFEVVLFYVKVCWIEIKDVVEYN